MFNRLKDLGLSSDKDAKQIRNYPSGFFSINQRRDLKGLGNENDV